MARRPPRVFFSFRSPFSWLALNRLQRMLPEVLDGLEWIPFWDPDPAMEQALEARGGGFHYATMSKAKHLYILQDTKRIARKLGLSMTWPIDDGCRWEVPHLAWLLARRLGHGCAYYQALVEARWLRGERICAPETAAAAGAALGLDPEALRGAADDPELRAEALECLVDAYEDGIFGVPYFRIGPHRFWGVDRVEDFAMAWHEANVEAAARVAAVAEPIPALAVGYDSDTSGGCG